MKQHCQPKFALLANKFAPVCKIVSKSFSCGVNELGSKVDEFGAMSGLYYCNAKSCLVD